MKKLAYLIWIWIAALTACGQIPYGNNPDAGNYIQTDDAKIYYEVYGSGDPLLLIHGSLYGYIDEFAGILPELTEQFKVIAVALRGHGKSEIGNRDYSYDLFADDMMKIMDSEQIDTFSILGFSAGAITALKISAEYPERVKKVVSIAGALSSTDKRPETLKDQQATTGEDFVIEAKAFVDYRKQIMPEPDRFIEFYERLKVAHLAPVWVSDEEAAGIKASVLIIGGDRDDYFTVDAFTRMYALIPDAKLLIVPESGHVKVLLNRNLYQEYAIPFLNSQIRI
ncbi:MAG: alpha/beta fold hydrolase [Bacteroidales bacterium]